MQRDMSSSEPVTREGLIARLNGQVLATWAIVNRDYNESQIKPLLSDDTSVKKLFKFHEIPALPESVYTFRRTLSLFLSWKGSNSKFNIQNLISGHVLVIHVLVESYGIELNVVPALWSEVSRWGFQ